MIIVDSFSLLFPLFVPFTPTPLSTNTLYIDLDSPTPFSGFDGVLYSFALFGSKV